MSPGWEVLLLLRLLQGLTIQENKLFVSMTGTFLDTLIICSLTALALSSSGVWISGETGVALTIQAFSSGLPGNGETSLSAQAQSLLVFLLYWRGSIMAKSALNTFLKKSGLVFIDMHGYFLCLWVHSLN